MTSRTPLLELPPLPRDLSRLVFERGLSQKALAEKAGLSRSVVSRVLSGERVPSPDQLRALCAALGVPAWRFLAFALRWERSGAWRRYRRLPGYDLLKQLADRYPQRRRGLLHLADPRLPLDFHTLSVTYRHPALVLPASDDDDPRGALWRRVQRLVQRGDLVPASKVYPYRYTFASRDNNLRLSLVPHARSMVRYPNMRPCRWHVSDLWLPGSPVRKAWRALVGPSAWDLRVTRFDVPIDYLNDLPTFDLVPPRVKFVRCYEDVLVARAGGKKRPWLVLYDNAKRGGGARVEFRYQKPQRHRGAWGLPLDRLAFFLNPLRDLVLWDLRASGVVDPALREALKQGQVSGARKLPTFGWPPHLLPRLPVHHDPLHPALVWDQHYLAAVQRLAERLDVAPAWLGLPNAIL